MTLVVAAGNILLTMKLEEIPGATPFPVCNELRKLAREVPAERAIIEIGVWRGRSVCHLGVGAKEGAGAHVWGIDPWDLPGERKTYLESVHRRKHDPAVGFTNPKTREAASRHVVALGLVDQVTLVRGFGDKIGASWSGPPVGLIYIDGNHHADAVRNDFAAWRPHLVPGALVLFDDYEPPFREVIAIVDALHREGALSRPEVLHGRLAVTRLA